MSIIDELIKAAKMEVQEQPSNPVTIDSNDIEKLADYLEGAGKVLQEGGEVSTLPPVKGEQKPVETEVKNFDTTDSKVDADGQVHTDEEEPVKGEQQEPAPPGKIASFRERIYKIAQESTPSNIGESPAQASTGLPEKTEDIVEATKEQVEQANVAKPLKPLFQEPPSTSADAMKDAFPQATKGEAEEKTAELQGRIAAHAFIQELTKIYGGSNE